MIAAVITSLPHSNSSFLTELASLPASDPRLQYSSKPSLILSLRHLEARTEHVTRQARICRELHLSGVELGTRCTPIYWWFAESLRSKLHHLFTARA